MLKTRPVFSRYRRTKPIVRRDGNNAPGVRRILSRRSHLGRNGDGALGREPAVLPVVGTRWNLL